MLFSLLPFYLFTQYSSTRQLYVQATTHTTKDINKKFYNFVAEFLGFLYNNSYLSV